MRTIALYKNSRHQISFLLKSSRKNTGNEIKTDRNNFALADFGPHAATFKNREIRTSLRTSCSRQEFFCLCDIFFKSEAGELQIVKDGTATDYSEEKATEILSQNPVIAIADVKQGDASATAWGCDLTFDYVKINADYRS